MLPTAGAYAPAMAGDHPLALPEAFRFGVATSGFGVEGGFNGPGEPANNWAEWERAGVVEPSGIALDFWRSYEEQFDRAAALGCDSFRLSVEWARAEPAPGEIDTDALDRYAAMLDAAAARGLEPVVALHHFTEPAWLGADFWLGLDAPELFARWVQVAVKRLQDHCRQWVTVNQPNLYAIQAYLTGAFPPGRRLAFGPALRALDHLLAGHVLAAREIRRRQPEAGVATTTYSVGVYELDQLLVDVLVAPRLGVARAGIGPHLRARRADWYASSAGAPATPAQRLLRRVAATAVPLEQALPRSIAEVYRSPLPISVDTVDVGYSDPSPWRHLRPPAQGAPLDGRLQRVAAAGIAVRVAESGLGSRVVRGRTLARRDGRDRPRYLREDLAALVRAGAGGSPVGGYWHRSLADSYEWGSYQPRFGLYGVDRDRGCRWSALDAMGHDAAGTYRRLIAAIRSGDPTELAGAGMGTESQWAG